MHDFNHRTTSDMWLYRAYSGNLYHNGEQTLTLSSFTQGDFITCVLDMEARTISFGKNGEVRSSTADTEANETYYIYICFKIIQILLYYHRLSISHAYLFVYLHKIKPSIKHEKGSESVPNCSLVIGQEPKLAFEDVDATELYPCVMFYSSNPGEKVREEHPLPPSGFL